MIDNEGKEFRIINECGKLRVQEVKTVKYGESRFSLLSGFKRLKNLFFDYDENEISVLNSKDLI